MARLPQKGFTIVELLIVIVVIGILAAIVIVAFNGVQNRANDTTVKADLTSFGKKLEMIKIDATSGVYPFASATGIGAHGFKASKDAYAAGNNLLYCRAPDGDDYAIIARSKSQAAFSYTPAQGIKDYTPAWTAAAGTTCTNFFPAPIVYTASWGGTWAGL